MAAPSPLATRIVEEHAAASDSLPAGVVSRERRRSAIDTLAVQGLPTSRDENWKYANLRPLDKVRFAPLAADASANADALSPVTLADLPPRIEGYARYTFVDGVFFPALSAPAERTGISVVSLRSDPERAKRTPPAYALREQSPSKDARFALLNEAFATDGASIRVAAGTDCPTCIELVFVANRDSQTAASYPRVELHVEAGATLGLIERHLSVGSDANFVNTAVSVDIARGASVNHYRVQQSGARAIWFDTLSAVLAQDATYRLHGVSLGGLSARSTINVQLAGERADAGIYVVSLGDRQQVQDAFVLVDHVAPRARSEQIFRGISAGRARVTFNGMVVVRKGAQGTDSQQSLRGLLAGPDAEIDVRPQLEIYTDDVRCSHGATAGKLDDNMLFYLLSRGLDPETAQRLLKWAFLEDVVAKIEVPELRRQIEHSLAGQLKDAAALKELL
ncbi:MAG: Fe-S cluster assembly protein SufD [Gammaproteobacteria bacterium]|nr:Fe-S cluster assembly protein SufD [Gammaproteobacteria bacterium]